MVERLGEGLPAFVAGVAAKHKGSKASAEASERQRRKEAQIRLDGMRRAARDPALGIPQGPGMLAKAMGKPSGAVATAMLRAYQHARGGEARKVCSVFVSSNPGSGKTTTGARVVLTHASQGDSALYVRAPILPAARSHVTEKLYDLARSVDLLVIDELGMEAEAATIVNLVLERHDNERVTFLLGNLSSKELLERYRLMADLRLRSRMHEMRAAGIPPVQTITDRDFRSKDVGSFVEERA